MPNSSSCSFRLSSLSGDISRLRALVSPTLLMPALQNLAQASAEPNLFGLCRVQPRLDENQIQLHLQSADLVIALFQLLILRIFLLFLCEGC